MSRFIGEFGVLLQAVEKVHARLHVRKIWELAVKMAVKELNP